MASPLHETIPYGEDDEIALVLELELPEHPRAERFFPSEFEVMFDRELLTR